jgi:methylmalonyl-CoA/ethylmalonyl-CoA epimerase
MRIGKIDHIAVAVTSIEEVLPLYRALGLEVAHREEVAGQKVVTAFVPVGETRIELLEPTAQDSPVGKFLARRGPGLHHICFAVDGIEQALVELQARGFRLLQDAPAAGADGKKVAFLHPESGKGVLIELSERARP